MGCTVELQRTVLTDAASFLQLRNSPQQPESPRAEGSWGSKAQQGQVSLRGFLERLPDPQCYRKERKGLVGEGAAPL